MTKIIPSFVFNSSHEKAFKKSLKLLLGFSPKNLSLYHQAFRHSSIKSVKEKQLNSNERLEFLGDAVVGLVVAEYLFRTHPFQDEGFLTQMRSRIVNRQIMNQLALKFGLENFLQSDLSKNEKIKSAALGDAFEALIGAIYLDKGFEQTKKFIIDRVVKIHIDMASIQQNDTDYKSQLQITTQKDKKKLEYKLLNEKQSGKDKIYHIGVFIDDQPFADFQHYSKKTAEQKAAQLTLEQLNHLS